MQQVAQRTILALPESPTGNYTQYPNSIYDFLGEEGLPLTAYLSPAEEKVLNRCIRETCGWHRNSFRMSLGELARLTGLSKQGVINCVKTLSEAGLIEYNSRNGVAIFTLKLDIEHALNYYISKYRTTELTKSTTEFNGDGVNLSECYTTEFTNSSTELTERQLSLPPSNKEKNQIKNQRKNTTTSTQKSCVLESESSSVIQADEPKNDTPELTLLESCCIAYCNALGWNYHESTAKTKSTATVKKLLNLYPATTPSEVEAIVRHAINVRGIKPSQLPLNWLSLANEVAELSNTLIKPYFEAIKAILGQTIISDKETWEITKIAYQAKDIYKLTIEQIMAFPELWKQECPNLLMPGKDKLLANIVRLKDTKLKGGGNGYQGKLDKSLVNLINARTIGGHDYV